MSKVTIKNSGHTFDVRPSQTVLQAAIEAGINLPYGCRNGACGACKAELIAGKVMHDDYQRSAKHGSSNRTHDLWRVYVNGFGGRRA